MSPRRKWEIAVAEECDAAAQQQQGVQEGVALCHGTGGVVAMVVEGARGRVHGGSLCLKSFFGHVDSFLSSLDTTKG